MSEQCKYYCRVCVAEVIAGPYIAPEVCSACQLAANAEGTRSANGEQDLLMQLRMRPYSNPSYWMLEAADTIERLQSAYDGLTPDQYHAGVARLLAALGNPEMDGRDVFTRVADEITALRAIINAKLHRRRCHDCGHVGWYADSRTPYCLCDRCCSWLCDRCRSWDTRRVKEEK